MDVRKRINVVGAVIVRGGEVLCAQRGPNQSLAGLWEFPGGKIEQGESARAALTREVIEELDCIITVGEELMTTTHTYDFGDVTLTTYWCKLRSGTPSVTEHSRMAWVAPSDLGMLQWAPADIPTVEAITSRGLLA